MLLFRLLFLLLPFLCSIESAKQVASAVALSLLDCLRDEDEMAMDLVQIKEIIYCLLHIQIRGVDDMTSFSAYITPCMTIFKL